MARLNIAESRFNSILPAAIDSTLGKLKLEASSEEGKYAWITAAALYEEALTGSDRIASRDTTLLADRLAKCYYKGAFQAASRQEFNRRMQLSQTWFGKSQALYSEAGMEGQAKRSKAREIFSTFWLEDHPQEKKELVGRCIELADEAAQVLKKLGHRIELAETRSDLLTYLVEAQNFLDEAEPLRDLLGRAILTGEEAMSEFEAIGESEGLLDSLYTTLLLLGHAQAVFEPSKFPGLEAKARGLMKKLAEVSGKSETSYQRCRAHEAAAWLTLRLEGNQSLALNLFDSAKLMAEQTGDSLVIGRVLSESAHASSWPAVEGEYGEGGRDTLEKGIRYASDAIKKLEIPFDGGWLEYVYSSYAECYISLAIFVETEPAKKKEYLRKAVEIARRGTSYEDHTWLTLMSHVLSKALYYLAIVEADRQEKLRLLRDALPMREETVRVLRLLNPQSWNVGVAYNYLALVKAELSTVEQDPAVKTGLLQGAALDMQECVDLCRRWAANPSEKSALAIYEESYGDILLQVHRSSGQTNAAQRSIRAYDEAIAYLSNLEHRGHIAPLRWKVAKIYDSVGNFKAASDAFMRAAEDYGLAAKRIPGSAFAFGELATYMGAWSMIEQARAHHNEEQLLLAAEKYSKASSVLKTTTGWNHLSKHYAACSFLEGGEALSRQERQDASIESLTAAVNAFRESREELFSKMMESASPLEEEELREWVRITDGRQTYCLGKIDLEEARILDRKGEVESSGAKYQSASQFFRELVAGARTGQDRSEFEILANFSEGWAKMKEAESRVSPELYSEAADSFARIEKVPTRRRFRLLALANANMCKALETGTRFRRTRNLQLYSEIKNQLEASADYYEEAGLKNAADWTRASQRLFDALAYMATAEGEMEPRKKTELYHLAEKHLDLAAKLFGDAGFQAKSEEARRHLKRAHQEKEILLTPIEVLAQNPAISGVSTVTPVSLTSDQAVGLERFGAANVVGNMTVPKNEISPGANLTVEFELANIGKTTATLIKLENMVIEGLEIDREKIQHPVDGNDIDMGGKRLEYLKTYEVEVPLRMLRKGEFRLKPRILFADEKGAYRTYEFDASHITVAEVASRSPLESERRLCAIMFTDMVNYTSLTEENEVLALELLQEHRKLLRHLFPKHNGKEIKTVGDMFLAEFPSGLEAVTCAIGIQDALSKHNQESSEAKKIRLRIGIHIGDVEHSRGDVYGDAVNIASRIQPLAEPGGIVVTRQVYEQIRNRPGIKMQSLGSRELKNVKEPLEVYRISI